MQASVKILDKIERENSGFLTSIYKNADILRRGKPWKYIPGPWALAVKVNVLGRNIVRVAVILGASNSENVGVIAYDSINAYASNRMDLFVTFKPQGEVPQNQWKYIQKSNILQELVPDKDSFPVFMRLSSAISEDDFLWFESALPAISHFIQHCACLGGGGRGTAPEMGVQLSPLDVLYSVLDPDLSGGMVMTSGVESLSGTYPCLQTVPSAKGDASVTIHVVPTQSVLAHAQNQPLRKDIAASSPFHVPEEYHDLPESKTRKCLVCGKTDSDLRSRGKSGLLLCACQDEGVRYCSKECQKTDWINHKRVCSAIKKNKGKSKTNASAAVSTEVEGHLDADSAVRDSAMVVTGDQLVSYLCKYDKLSKVDPEVALAVFSTVIRVLNKEDETVARQVGLFILAALEILVTLGRGNVLVFTRGMEAIGSYLKCMDNQEYIRSSDISQIFDLTRAHCLRDLATREDELHAADAAEWILNFICYHSIANAKTKMELGNVGACELVGELLRKFVLVSSSDVILDEAQVQYSNKVAKIVSYAAGNLCQNKTLDNKKKLRAAGVCEALTTLVGENSVVSNPKVKEMAISTVRKINDNKLLKFSGW